MDQSGNVYGTTSYGGKHGDEDVGVVYELVPNAQGTYKEYTLHDFCKQASCKDGAAPFGKLIIDKDGHLFGTTAAGGKYDAGVIFELSHFANAWHYSVIYNFCPLSGCKDGLEPVAGLAYVGQSSGAPWDEFSPLFGTTANGGQYGHGVTFELVEDGSLWNYTVIHNFNTSRGPDVLLVDSSFNVYGTTETGGKYNGGLMYKLAGGTWTETVLHNFCAETNCADGMTPFGGLSMDSSGNLYGTAGEGGSGSRTACGNSDGCGVAFERTAGGTFSVLYNFCSLSQCSDGYDPEGGLIVDSLGHLYATTELGGEPNNGGAGVFFELASSQGSWAESVLYTFCTTNCLDGAAPEGGLLKDAKGNYWGETFSGGHHNDGTAFELIP